MNPALGDLDPHVREHALRLAEGFGLSAGMANRFEALVDDPDPRVRNQMAFTLGSFRQDFAQASVTRWLAALARKDAENEPRAIRHPLFRD